MELKFGKQLPENKRVQILQAVHLIVDRHQKGELLTSVSMPPRFGKSDVIRLSAMELNAITKMPTVVTAPWTDNADQIMETPSIEEMYSRFGITFGEFMSHRVRKLPTHEWWKLSVGVPTLLTCTIGLINNKSNQQQFLDGISDLHQRIGARVPVVIDECHLVKDVQAWGKFALRIVENGGYLILLTGTPVPGIPGFANEFGPWMDVIRKITRRQIVNGELKHILETYEGPQREISEIRADYTVTWKEAWDLGALAKVNAIWIDLDVVDEETNEPLGPLSELAVGALNGRLKSIMESPELMAKQVNAGLHRLFQLRSKERTKNAQMLVVTGADAFIDEESRERDVNVHAREFKKLIEDEQQTFNKDLRIEIATGATENAAGIIKQFRKGQIDVLIVKNMGLVGLDCKPCKVEIFGSRLRSGPLAIQALSRPLTKWDSCPASIILPKDCKMMKLYDQVVKQQGGEYRESNLQLVDSVEVPSPDEKPEWVFQGARVDAYSDEKGGTTVGDYELELLLIKSKYDTNGLTDRQIIENHIKGGFPISDSDRAAYKEEKSRPASKGIKDLDAEYERVRGRFGDTARQITNKYLNFPLQKAAWLEKNKELKARAKECCGVTREVDKIDDVALLQKLINALYEVEVQVFSHERTRKSN